MLFRESTKKRDCSWTWTHNHLVHKRTINHLAKLAKCLRSVVSTYLYGTFDCMFLSLSRKRFKVNPHSSLAKWLSVCLRTKWLWVRVMLQLNLQFHLNFRFRACFEQAFLEIRDMIWPYSQERQVLINSLVLSNFNYFPLV